MWLPMGSVVIFLPLVFVVYEQVSSLIIALTPYANQPQLRIINVQQI